MCPCFTFHLRLMYCLLKFSRFTTESLFTMACLGLEGCGETRRHEGTHVMFPRVPILIWYGYRYTYIFYLLNKTSIKKNVTSRRHWESSTITTRPPQCSEPVIAMGKTFMRHDTRYRGLGLGWRFRDLFQPSQ